MLPPPYAVLTEPAAPAPLYLNLAPDDAALLAHPLAQPPPRLLVDCGNQPCRRSLGMCYFLSQLLLLRQRGASVWLRNADPQLRRCLRQLGLQAAFFLAD